MKWRTHTSATGLSLQRIMLKLASGFFYNILPLGAADWRIGKYPFIYYGKKEYYRIKGDSLFVYSTPYKYWTGFRISCKTKQTITLTSKDNTLELVKSTMKL
jgi:hypothetical protein